MDRAKKAEVIADLQETLGGVESLVVTKNLGLTAAQVSDLRVKMRKEGVDYKVGKAELKDTGMGGALQENGLAKVLADTEGNILGVHIVGPQASVLIHEAIIAMKANGTVDAITNSVYIHPALPEWLQRAFFAIE